MWVNKLEPIPDDDTDYVRSLRKNGAPTVSAWGVRASLVMDIAGFGYLIVEVDGIPNGYYGFNSTMHAITEWTAIVVDFTRETDLQLVREALAPATPPTPLEAHDGISQS